MRGAPVTFQRLMTAILIGIQRIKCLPYFDEVLVFGENLEVHERLREIFSRIRKYNMKLQPDKCGFLRKGVSYLGHIIGQTGVRPDEKRRTAMKEYPEPRTTRELKGFLRIARYNRRFIPNFGKIVKF